MRPSSAAQPRKPTLQNQPLRSVPAGYDINRWPIAVPIRTDEAIESWLTRAARRYAIKPRQLVIAAGVRDRVDNPGQLTRMLRRDASTLALRLGCPEADVAVAAAEMLPDAAVVDYLVRFHRVSRPIPTGSGFCPVCLAEPDPHWKRQWSAMFATTCVDHGCLLLRTCPRCGERPWSTASWLSHDPAGPLYACPNRPRRPSGRMIRRRRCKFDLRKIEPFVLDAETVAAHKLVYRLWQQYGRDPASLQRLAGVEVTAKIAVDALCELIDESIGIFSLFDDDTHDRPALVAALRTAARILSAPSTTVAAQQADAHRLLNPAGPATPIGPGIALLRRRHNPLLAAIRLGSVRATLSPVAQLTYDCGHRHPRYPIRRTDERSWQRLPEHRPDLPDLDAAGIPQVLWSNTAWAPTGDASTLAAAAQAMALTKIGDARPWKIIALDLGLPKDIALPVTRYWRHIVRTGGWPDALATLTNLKEQLRENPAPIDYQQRRIIADDPRRLLRALNKANASSHNLGETEFHHVVRRFWELFTGGDIGYAPTPYAIPTGQTIDWPEIRLRIDAEHAETFHSAYQTMLVSCSPRPAGPLTWRPP